MSEDDLDTMLANVRSMMNELGGVPPEDDAPRQEEPAGVIELAPSITIQAVTDLKEAWLPVLETTRDIEINVQRVEQMDTAGAQLLVSFVKSIKSQGRKVTWSGASIRFGEVVDLLQLDESLGLD